MKKSIYVVLLIVMVSIVFLGGCCKVKPVDVTPQPPVQVTPAAPTVENKDIELQVDKYRSQIKDLFQRYSAEQAMFGTVIFKLYITETGKIADAEITPKDGKFTPEFLKAAREVMITWKFNTPKKVVYEFSMSFSK
jgi:hypothetical protein